MIPTILFIVTWTPIFHLEILYYLNILLDSIVIIGLKSRGFAIPLVGNKFNLDAEDFYRNHLKALQTAWIIKNTDPTLEELRWYVMLMLMRAGNN